MKIGPPIFDHFLSPHFSSFFRLSDGILYNTCHMIKNSTVLNSLGPQLSIASLKSIIAHRKGTFHSFEENLLLHLQMAIWRSKMAIWRSRGQSPQTCHTASQMPTQAIPSSYNLYERLRKVSSWLDRLSLSLDTFETGYGKLRT